MSDIIDVLCSEPSGRMDTVVYSHNRYGIYTRPYVAPVQPASTPQLDAQTAFATAVARWSTIPESSRAGWRIYAHNLDWYDRLHQKIHLNGFHHFIRAAMCRAILGQPLPSAAPSTFLLPAFDLPIAAYGVVATQKVLIDWTDQPWMHQSGNVMHVYSYNTVPLTHHFYAHPWQTIGFKQFPPFTVADEYPSPFVLATGRLLPFALRLQTRDQRVSRMVKMLVPIHAS